MNLGGTEKAFLSFANELLKLDVELELILLEYKGELLGRIPKEINIKVLEYAKVKNLFENAPLLNLRVLLKQQQWMLFVQYLFYRIVLVKFFNMKFPFYKWLSNLMLASKTHATDVAIAYAGPHELISYLVSEKIVARKKIQWIHFDISKVSFDSKFYTKIAEKFNQFFVVSNFVKQQLLLSNQIFEDKTNVFYNYLPTYNLKKLAKIGISYNDNYKGLRILSIGRFTVEKGMDIALKTAGLLKKSKVDFKWYFVGDGPQKNSLMNSAKLMGLENDIIFLGKLENPYNYLKSCDIYVQPSRQEGFGITISEAKFFNKPIVVTNIPGFKEQIVHKETGYICKGLHAENILEGIKYFLDEKNRTQIISNLAIYKNGNQTEIKEFLKVID
ncbi:glycosyltransferase involved in cell wall biosynthesis [Lutibacter oceani]|uniref:Glycosyltransferase involved in cell wall biosynthesis n=2 Tax=Lutibacter oceani TaxID=1853311 RepID=A0A3D9RZU1_9FLAO|nr:glycosyltransferase involved in cell wall biosynthesis [Lutibacter oceani]